MVLWSVSGLKNLWVDDVSDRKRACNSSAGEGSFGMARTISCRPMSYHGQWCDDGVDEIEANEKACGISLGQEGHQSSTNDARNATNGYPCPALGRAADTKADQEGEEDADDARWHVEKRGIWRAES